MVPPTSAPAGPPRPAFPRLPAALAAGRTFLLAALLGALLLPGAAATRPPNIVFILTDDLGIHDLACDGRTEHRTPQLDRLAAEGTRFTSAYCAQPICSPSRAALLTGRAPARLHLTTYLPGRRDAPSQRLLHPGIRQALPLEEVTLAERLRDLGYATACIGKWHLGGQGFGPGQQGFDHVYAGRANTTPSATEGGKGEYDLTRNAAAFLEQHRDRPFFVFLSHNTPHIPYTARPDQVARHADAFEPTYAAVLESLDETVGQLLRKLDDLGLRERTLVIFTSDNGGLHVPELQHARVTHNGPFRAGKGFLYEGGLRVPLIVRWPGRVPAGRVVHAPFLNTRWLATLLDLAGAPPASGLDGDTARDLLLGGTRPERSPLFWHFPHYSNQGGRPGGAVRSGRWKLIEFYDTGETELYDLRRDPGESVNLAASQGGRVRRLQQALAGWRTSVGAQTNAMNPRFDAARFRELYVDFDPSRFRPATAPARDWERVAAWRRAMDEVVRTGP